MKKNVVTAAALVLSAIVPAAAQTAPAAAARTPVPQVAPAQEIKPTPPFHTPGPRVDITLEEAVARAREKNIDIAVARITPRLSDFSILGLEANYLVNLTANTNQQRSSRLPTSTIQGITTITPTTTTGWSSGFAQNMWRGGGSWSLNFQNSRVNTPATNNLRNPQFNSTLAGSYIQPLMRGFRIDTNRASLQTTRISQQNDEISLQTTVATTDANTRNAYWDLVYAIQAVDAAQNSLDIANKLVADNRARVEIGTLAPLDVRTSESEAANVRLTLVQDQGTVRSTELALKRLIVSGTDDPLWTSSINPTDRPPTTPEPLNVDAAIARALRERTDMQQSKNSLKISDINLRLQEDQTRPQLTLTLSYGLQGLGGPQIVPGGTTLPSGYWDAIRNIYGLDAPQWNFLLNFAYPLGRSAQQATVARSRLSLEQSQANVKALELQIATDVQSAALTVQTSLESVQAAQVARQLAQEKLGATQSKLDVGMATNYEVVQAQRDFADAQNAELRAVANYRKALVSYETAQTVGTRAVGATVTSGTTGTGATTTSGTSSSGTGGTGGTSGSGGSGGSGGGSSGGSGGL